MLFVISCVFSVLGFFLAFFGITHENFTNHPKRVKWFKIIMGVFMVVSLVVAYLENQSDKNKNDEQFDTIQNLRHDDSLSNLQIDSLVNIVGNIESTLKDVYNLTITKDSVGNVKIIDSKTRKNVGYTNSTICPIRLYIKKFPSDKQQELCNGDKIPLEYKTNKDGLSFTVPYMAGKDFAGSFTMNNMALTGVGYDKKTGTFDVSVAGVSGVMDDANYIEFNANITSKNSPQSAVIKIKLPKDGAYTTITDDFFSQPITEISVYSQSYIIDVDFMQDISKKTITFINGTTLGDGTVLVARR